MNPGSEGWGRRVAHNKAQVSCSLTSTSPCVLTASPTLASGACFGSPILGINQQWFWLENELAQSHKVGGICSNSILEFGLLGWDCYF